MRVCKLPFFGCSTNERRGIWKDVCELRGQFSFFLLVAVAEQKRFPGVRVCLDQTSRQSIKNEKTVAVVLIEFIIHTIVLLNTTKPYLIRTDP